MAIIQDRKANPPARSYTTTLLGGGTRLIGEKILEESREVVEAADLPGNDGRAHLIHEVADLTYHLCVLLGHKDIAWREIEMELARRFGTCGLDEKDMREEG